jgi:hypothetical protein
VGEVPTKGSGVAILYCSGALLIGKCGYTLLNALTDPNDKAEALAAYKDATKKNKVGFFSNLMQRWFTNSQYDEMDKPVKRFKALSDSGEFPGEYSYFFTEDFNRAHSSARNDVHTSTPKDSSSNLPSNDKSDINADSLFDPEATPKPSNYNLESAEGSGEESGGEVEAGANLSDDETRAINPESSWNSSKEPKNK